MVQSEKGGSGGFGPKWLVCSGDQVVHSGCSGRVQLQRLGYKSRGGDPGLK